MALARQIKVLIKQGGIAGREAVRPEVMFPHEERVQGSEPGVFVGTHVAAEEKLLEAGLRLVGEAVDVEREEIISRSS